jgi:putative ABC transport system substrate-binding protein
MAFRAPILAFAIERRMPVITASRTFADPGVLLAYGASTAEGFRRAAGYIDKVLKGAKPADPARRAADKIRTSARDSG